MPNYKIRTTAPEYDNPYYPHGMASEGQCTYGCYYRTKEIGWPYPCMYDKKTPGYRNAKQWPEHVSADWEAHYISKEPNYRPVPGDICVFDGNYGHVIFLEDLVENDIYLISHWNIDGDQKYKSEKWHLGDRIRGKDLPTGFVKAYLHYKMNNSLPVPVSEDKTVDQLLVMDPAVYVRSAPSLNGSKYGFAKIGYYNVYAQGKADGYTWVKVSDSENYWIAVIENVTVFIPKYTPSEDIDILKKQLEEAYKKLDEDSKVFEQIISLCESRIKN